MAANFAFELVSPERLLLASNDVTEVSVPGAEGYFTVMANHSSLMSTIKPGIVTVKQSSGADLKFVVLGGFADVTPAGCSILAESATPVGEINLADIDAQIAEARTAASSAKGDEDMVTTAAYLDHLTSLRGLL
ncbi:MAG: F0F1 ATP synthase subunit epsilon [Notoacmeibacter sp.]